MGVQKLRLDRLDPAERAEIEAALRDPERFHSDGREVSKFVFGVALLLLGPLVVLVVLDGQLTVYPGEPTALDLLAAAPSGWIKLLLNRTELCGAVAVVLVQFGLVGYGVRTYGRHGHLVTSFGVVRIRGPALRVLRYADIADVTVIDRGRPQYSIVTTELELKARDGSTMSLFGYGATSMKAKIEAAVAASRG